MTDPSENTIRRARSLGQSIWYDSISRELIESGELARLVGMGITGVTSNPTIFDQAIAAGSSYDEALARHGRAEEDPARLFEALAVEDVRAAADVLRGVYEETDGADGYVSVEVSPLLARDTAGTVVEARRLFSAIGRPNVMIKVPGTPEGMPAVRTLIGEGINVNVTLLFAVEAYRDAAGAYIDGLADYARRDGRRLGRVASVASFFVSRVDTVVDGRLQALIDEGAARDARELLGRAGIANAKLAYAEFQELFEGARFAGPAASGARPQRPLWGSTGVKNPAYPDVLYMDELMGPHTVNTAPPATLEAFLDHGTPGVTVTRGVDEARAQLARLGELGIDLEAVTDDLLAAGVEAFSESFRSLLRRVGEKRRELCAP